MLPTHKNMELCNHFNVTRPYRSGEGVPPAGVAKGNLTCFLVNGQV